MRCHTQHCVEETVASPLRGAILLPGPWRWHIAGFFLFMKLSRGRTLQDCFQNWAVVLKFLETALRGPTLGELQATILAAFEILHRLVLGRGAAFRTGFHRTVHINYDLSERWYGNTAMVVRSC